MRNLAPVLSSTMLVAIACGCGGKSQPRTPHAQESATAAASTTQPTAPPAVATTQPTTKPTASASAANDPSSVLPKKKAKPKTTRPGPADAKVLFDVPVSPPLEVADAIKSFKIANGFHVEAVASEPMVEEPIAMSFD